MAEHAWDYLGKQGQGIQKVLQDIDEDDDLKRSKPGRSTWKRT